MLKILILFTLSAQLAFATSRITEGDKQNFMDEVKQEIAAHKIENRGVIDFQIIKPGLYQELDVYYKQEKFTREEMIKIKQDFEGFAKKYPNLQNSKGAGANEAQSNIKEKAFYKFVQDELDEINQTAVEKVKEGYVCNSWGCEEGLKCAPDPRQEDGKTCRKAGRECSDESDCCSSSCTLDKRTNKRFCEEVYRCFRPLNIGQSCMNNPVCGEGECLAFNSKTSGIGECSDRGYSCKKNTECCSNSCNNHRCVDSYVCKDCVNNGKTPTRGQKCCEGLYKNSNGVCAPDVPPVVMPQVRSKFFNQSIKAVSTFFIGTAQADEAYDTVSGDKRKYENFQATSADADKIDVKSPVFTLTRQSNFETCDINFHDDYMNYLQKSKLLDLELAFTSFDFVLSGDGVNDYWTKSADPSTSLYGRLKSIALKHQLLTKATNEKIAESTKKLTCMCLDVIGYANIKDAAKKKLFESCPEFSTATSAVTCYKKVSCTSNASNASVCISGSQSVSCNDGEAGCTCASTGITSIVNENASGVKAKKMLVSWTNTLQEFNQSLTVDNTTISRDFADISTWSVSEAKWNDAENRKYTLFNFDIKNPSGSVAAMGAILGALLAAGIIAILGGFASTSILTAWAAAGIIASSAITGGTGLWLMASLKGAWTSKRPEIFDKYIRTYGCGKKETCIEYSRELNQPYNNICNVHTSANACIKNFVVFYQDAEPRYVVDPWIPNGIAKNLILRDIGDPLDYAKKLEAGFQRAKATMISKNPVGSATGSKDDSGVYQPENYMSELFVDTDILGSYTPILSLDPQQYLLTDQIITEIKKQAIAYAIRVKFFYAEPATNPSTEQSNSKYCAKDDSGVLLCSQEKENLDKFADYTYDYHFLWPKTSRMKEISYPTVGLSTYLDLMANGVASSMAAGSANAAKALGVLNSQYLNDYLKTLQLYRDSSIQADAATKKAINNEIAKVQLQLDNQKTLNALLANGSLDTQLLNANQGLVNSTAQSSGVKGSVALTSDQAKFVNAIGTLRVARKIQLKNLENYKQAIATSGNPDRANRIASASKNFSSVFSQPVGVGRGASLFGSGASDVNAPITGAASEDVKREAPRNYNNDGGGLGAGGYGAGSATQRSTIGKITNEDKGSGGSHGVSDEDRKKLSDAIDARDRASKEKYASKEEQTIFEKVTNAYIRNYDKVLTKKKDKDVTEQK
jgi:hypothetical protein